MSEFCDFVQNRKRGVLRINHLGNHDLLQSFTPESVRATNAILDSGPLMMIEALTGAARAEHIVGWHQDGEHDGQS